MHHLLCPQGMKSLLPQAAYAKISEAVHNSKRAWFHIICGLFRRQHCTVQGKQESQPYLVSFPLEELINLRCTLTPDKSQLILSADLNQVHNILECICNPSEQR